MNADAVLPAVRFFQFSSVMVLFGWSLFPFYAGTRVWPPRRALIALVSLAVFSALAWLLIETVSMSGKVDAWRDPGLIGKVLADTEFGHISRGRVLIFAGMAIALSLPRRWPLAELGLSGLLVATLAGVGHGAMGIAAGAYLHLVNQALHMLAASVWIGGLVPLLAMALSLRHGRVEGPVLHLALLRFSGIGMAAVCLILASGTVNAYYLVGSLPALFGSSYGRVLCLKIGLFLAMTGLAAINRLVLLPRFGGAETAKWLLRTIAAEQALALAVVLAVSYLGTMMPPFGMSM